MTTGNRPTRASCAVAALTASVLVLAVSCGGSGHHCPRAPVGLPARRARAGWPGGRSRRPGRAFTDAVRAGQPQDVRAALRDPLPGGRGGCPAEPRNHAGDGLASRGSNPPPALRVALASGPRGISLSVQGRPVHVGGQAQRALRAGFAQPSGAATGAGVVTTPFGLDAAAWLEDPRYVTPAGGRSAESVHVRASLAVAPFIRDVRRLAGICAVLEEAGGRTGAGSLALALAEAAEMGDGAGTVDLYADPRSQLPRSLIASVKVHPDTAGSSSPRVRSSPLVSVSLRMGFTALGEAAGAGSS